MIKTYSEMVQREGFDSRFDYLKLGGSVGVETFGFDRYLNQNFYQSRLWKSARNHAIARDLGCDLGCDGYEIHDKVYVHHMNPMRPDQIKDGDLSLIDPEFLITTSHKTHNAIHFGDERLLPRLPVVRMPGDTKLW